jgi:hypothetical protein
MYSVNSINLNPIGFSNSAMIGRIYKLGEGLGKGHSVDLWNTPPLTPLKGGLRTRLLINPPLRGVRGICIKLSREEAIFTGVTR